VSLADAGRFHDDEVKPGRPAGGDAVSEGVGHLGGGRAGGEGTEEDLRPLDGVHPDPVAEQGTPTPTAGGVDSQYGDAQLVVLVEAEAADELVGERRLARPARPRDPEDGDAPAGGGGPQIGTGSGVEGA